MGAQLDEMIAAAQGGSESALLQLLEICRPQLQRYANYQCASDDVEEAVQDALWLLYRRLGALRVISAFSGWLFQIIRRECTRRARRRARWLEFDEAASSTFAIAGAADEDLRIDCSRAISSLPQGYREVLVLRDVTGLSSEEAAARLGIPLAAAKSRLHRARQMIRIRLQGVASVNPGSRKAGKIEEKSCTSVIGA